MKQIVHRPLITEKTLALAARGWFTFAVDADSHKKSIASAVKQLYNVDVVSVRTVSMHGKTKRTGRRMVTVKRPDWKKALVQLKQGQKIDAFEVQTHEEPAKK